MKAGMHAPAHAIATAFVIWFVHFMLCWAAAEIWPHDARANRFAWCATAVALLAMAVHFARLRRRARRGDGADANADADAEPTRRIARGATAIATLAILFTALPSIVWQP